MNIRTRLPAAWSGAAALLLAVSAHSAQAQTAAPDVVARSLAATCANCHGTDGVVKGGMKIRLAGMKAESMIETMTAYKTGKKTGTIMHQIAKGYTDDQIKLMAGYFAAQKAQ